MVTGVLVPYKYNRAFGFRPVGRRTGPASETCIFPWPVNGRGTAV